QYCSIRHHIPRGSRRESAAPVRPRLFSRGIEDAAITRLPGYCQIGSKTIPRQRSSAHRVELRCFDTLLKPGERDAPDPAFDAENTDLRGPALFFAAQGQPVGPRLAHRYCKPGLDRPRDRGDLPSNPPRRAALARNQRRMRRRTDDETGDAFQSDWNVLQPDAAILDRRRRGSALAG